MSNLASKIAESDTRYLGSLYFIKQERSKKMMYELCFYSGVATLSLLFGAAALINPIGAMMLGFVIYGATKNEF